jgi:hypothetical protein
MNYTMNTFTSKELYMMNGGDKLYIYKDGFGDIYQATATEEEDCKQEYISKTFVKIDTETNAVLLKLALENLRFHQLSALTMLLITQLNNVNLSPELRAVFKMALPENHS